MSPKIPNGAPFPLVYRGMVKKFLNHSKSLEHKRHRPIIKEFLTSTGQTKDLKKKQMLHVNSTFFYLK